MESIFGCSNMKILARMVSHLSSDQLCMFMDALANELSSVATKRASMHHFNSATHYQAASNKVREAFYSLENIPS